MNEILPPHLQNSQKNKQTELSNKKGRLIVIEGIDGSGKTSTIEAVKIKLAERGLKVTTFKNHAGPTSPYWQSVKITKEQLNSNQTKLSREIDRALQALEFLTYCRTILPVLMSEFDVIFADRYTLSKLIYGRVEVDEATQAESIISLADDIPIPDVTILLNVSIVTALKRINLRNTEQDWKEKPHNLEKAKALYETYTHSNSDIITLNAELSSEEVVSEIVSIYDKLN